MQNTNVPWYRKRCTENDNHKDTLVQKGFNLHEWLFNRPYSKIFLYDYCPFHCIVQCNSDSESVSILSVIGEKTSADLYISKMKQPPHQSIVIKVTTMLAEYLRSTKLVGIGGGDRTLSSGARQPRPGVPIRLFSHIYPQTSFLRCSASC